MSSGWDFCFDPSKSDQPTESPTLLPTTESPTVSAMPTYTPDYFPVANLKEVEYDQNQNYAGRAEVEFGAGETSLTGESWLGVREDFLSFGDW